MINLFYDDSNKVYLKYYADLPAELKDKDHLQVEVVDEPNEMIEIVRKYNFALGEFDRATYKVRDYFNKHARLPEVVENVDEDVEEHSK